MGRYRTVPCMALSGAAPPARQQLVRKIQRRLEEECEKRSSEFRENRISIMVATDAYGQGIDKPDIDVIVHWQPPLNMETYVNQIGRAGRDGRHSLCRLCWSNSNDWNMMLHDKGYFAQELKQLMAQDLEVELESRVALLSIVTEHRCRWHGILSHYACAAELEVPRGCGVCDVCVGKEVGMKRSTASDGEQNLALLILDCVKFASSHGEATKGRVIQIAREGASGFRHPCSVGMLEAIEAKRCRLPGPPLKRALEDMFLRLQDSGYLLPCLPSYAIQQPMKKLSWGVELSRSGLEALSRDGVIQLVPERRGTSGSESKQHRQTIRQLKKALKEFASVKGDPEALEDALIHLQHVASDQACKSKPPVKRDAPPRVKQDETDSVLRQMKGICPDMQIRYENLGPDQRQFIMEIPSQQIKHSGKPSRYESVSRKDALETIKIPVKKWWVPRYVGDNLRDDDVSCNVKLGKQAMWKAEIYVKPSGKTFASRRSFPRWVDAVWSAIASVPENNMFQKRVKLE
ncbi:unnamed protein product [Symbiodinium pilosum]|uniref:DNA 3'-5' helicase n=1 Tax=Symbiodinium pilosum TaxID=2952 RepID=A0A812MSK0_SYMPI|nr:unnamed protein product [Symbiodinium pilosum]